MKTRCITSFITSLLLLVPLLGSYGHSSRNILQVSAAVYDGDGGLEAGVEAAEGIEGPINESDIRSIIIDVFSYVLSFMALFAVIAIMVAGIYLIVSGGSDNSKEKAKNIIIYTVIGLVLILTAKLIVYVVLGVL